MGDTDWVVKLTDDERRQSCLESASLAPLNVRVVGLQSLMVVFLA